MGVTKADLIAQTRRLYTEALVLDEPYVLEATRAITGGEVFSWDLLTVRQLRALGRCLFVVRLQAGEQ